MTSLGTLSADQRIIYDYIVEGKSIDDIIHLTGKSLQIINAQLTRIRNKGIQLPQSEQPEQPEQRIPSQPQSGPTTMGQLEEKLKQFGSFKIPNEVLQQVTEVTNQRDIHPLILIGVTINYVRLCGGRFSAHQMIEDIYETLRLFCNVSVMDDVEHKTTQPNFTPEMRINALESEIADLKRRLAKYEA